MKNLLSKIKTFAEDNPHFIFSLFAFILTITALVLCFTFPSSAADEPSEGGQSSAPTDLTGTIWNIPSDWTAAAGYGQFHINGSLVANNSGADYSYTLYDYSPNFIIGYAWSSGSPSSFVDRISFYSSSASGAIETRYISPSYSFTLSILSGDDVRNPNLISWLMANGTWTNPPSEPEPTPTYTIQPNYYQIKLQPDMIPDDVGFYEYGGQFIYESETYRSLRFARVSSLLTNVYLYDDDGNQVVIKGQTSSNDGWFSGRNITLVSPITTENEEAYTYFIENLSATEQSPFDLVAYIISGFFKALDNFYIFFDVTLLDFIFVICGLLGAIWFLKLLAGG